MSRTGKRGGGSSVIVRIDKTDAGPMGGGQDGQEQCMIRMGKRGGHRIRIMKRESNQQRMTKRGGVYW